MQNQHGFAFHVQTHGIHADYPLAYSNNRDHQEKIAMGYTWGETVSPCFLGINGGDFCLMEDPRL